MKREYIKKTRGITLIALVVTIVVLIVLATISINAVLGKDGLIKRAEKSAEHQANAEKSEVVALKGLEEYIANVIVNNDSKNEEVLQINYAMENIDARAKSIVLSYPEELEPSEEDLEKVAVDLIVSLGMGTTIDDFWKAIMGSTKEDVKNSVESGGTTYKDFLEMYLQLMGFDVFTVTAENATHKIEGIGEKFIATRNGIYTVTATSVNGKQAEAQIEVSGLVEEKFSSIYETTATYTDASGATATIPAGFAVGTSEGINTIADGLVITDAVDEDGYSIGNEFVWIPVESDETFIRESFESTTLETNYTEPFNYTIDETNYTGYETEETEYNNMKTQVLAYDGFYIGRYETGKYGTKINMIPEEKIVIKRGMATYNYVRWGQSMNEVGTDGAVYLSQNMYADSSSVTSTLIYGVQWDAMCRYIGDYTRTTDIKDEPELTGSISTDVSKNIYDLAGNCLEWTMEADGTSCRVVRGGSYNNKNEIFHRGGEGPDYVDGSSYGFRTTLYIK